MRSAALAFRPTASTANLSIAPYLSRRARDACTMSDVFVRLYRYRDIGVHAKSPLISETSRHVTFPLPLQRTASAYVTLTFAKKGQNALTSVFRFQYTPKTWAKRSYLAEWQMRGSRCSLCFWPALTYFCHYDTHLDSGLWLHSAYSAVVRFRTTAAFSS